MDAIGQVARDYILSRPDAYLWCLDPSFDDEYDRIGRRVLGGRWSARIGDGLKKMLVLVSRNLLKQHDELLDAFMQGECTCAECERSGPLEWRLVIASSATHWDVLCATCAQFREELLGTIQDIGRI